VQLGDGFAEGGVGVDGDAQRGGELGAVGFDEGRARGEGLEQGLLLTVEDDAEGPGAGAASDCRG
jgi:hypothetical protein